MPSLRDLKVSSIRMPMLIQGRLESTVTNIMHFEWEVTRTHGDQPNGAACGWSLRKLKEWPVLCGLERTLISVVR